MDTQHTLLVDQRVSGRTCGVSQLQVSASSAEIQQCQRHILLLCRPHGPAPILGSQENVDQSKPRLRRSVKAVQR